MELRHRHRKAARLARKSGFAEILPRHTALFFQRSDTLIVSFDNMKCRDMPAPAFPWGYDAISKAEHSHLGVMMSRRNDWFRQPELDGFFDRLRDHGFFDAFARVVFFGASMGGYAALSYSAACPGADVVVFAPQSSLDPNVVPFETRYPRGYARGAWSGPYADGAQTARFARQIVAFADPHHAVDAAHIGRLPARNLRWMRCPNFGHNPARILKHMGLLGPVLRSAWAGTLSPQGFTALQRDQRALCQSHARRVLQRGLEQGHAELVHQIAGRLQRTTPGWAFPRIRAQADKLRREFEQAAA